MPMNPLIALGMGWAVGLLLTIVYLALKPQTAFRWGAKVAQRMLLVKGENAGWKLRVSKFRDGMETVGSREWKDELSEMGRLFGRPFGLAHGKRRLVYSPALAEVGEFYGERVENGNQQLQRDETIYANGFLSLDWGGRRAVDPDGILALLGRSGDPDQNSRVDDFVEWGQQGFKEASMGDWLKLLGGFVAVYGLMFIASYAMDQGASSSVPDGTNIAASIVPVVF